jgi:hypothetical protein
MTAPEKPPNPGKTHFEGDDCPGGHKVEKSPEEVLERARKEVHDEHGICCNMTHMNCETPALIDRLAEIAGIVGQLKEHSEWCYAEGPCEDGDRLLAKLRELGGREGKP